jgi:hypothetical protein
MIMYEINKWSEKKQRSDSDEIRIKNSSAKQKEEIGFQPGQFAPNDSINVEFNNDPLRLNSQVA